MLSEVEIMNVSDQMSQREEVPRIHFVIKQKGVSTKFSFYIKKCFHVSLLNIFQEFKYFYTGNLAISIHLSASREGLQRDSKIFQVNSKL